MNSAMALEMNTTFKLKLDYEQTKQCERAFYWGIHDFVSRSSHFTQSLADGHDCRKTCVFIDLQCNLIKDFRENPLLREKRGFRQNLVPYHLLCGHNK